MRVATHNRRTETPSIERTAGSPSRTSLVKHYHFDFHGQLAWSPRFGLEVMIRASPPTDVNR